MENTELTAQQKWYQDNREIKIQNVLQYQKDNKESVNAQHRKWYDERKQKALILLGGKCSNPFNLPHPDWCNDSRCLQFDHIKGGGNNQRRHLGSIAILSYILKHPKEFQLLCANCNWIKRYLNEEHGQKEIKEKI